MMRIKLARTVEKLVIASKFIRLQLKKTITDQDRYDCPHQRNFTANIVCRQCGNAGHFQRDCPDRPRGASWHDNKPAGEFNGRPAGRIGARDDADKEYEVSFPFYVILRY
jgi:hypothetical protein